jgi:hypothetical protein
VIEDRIKLPITVSWNEASHFRVRALRQEIVVDAMTARLVAA